MRRTAAGPRADRPGRRPSRSVRRAAAVASGAPASPGRDGRAAPPRRTPRRTAAPGPVRRPRRPGGDTGSLLTDGRRHRAAPPARGTPRRAGPAAVRAAPCATRTKPASQTLTLRRARSVTSTRQRDCTSQPDHRDRAGRGRSWTITGQRDDDVTVQPRYSTGGAVRSRQCRSGHAETERVPRRVEEPTTELVRAAGARASVAPSSSTAASAAVEVGRRPRRCASAAAPPARPARRVWSPDLLEADGVAVSSAE